MKAFFGFNVKIMRAQYLKFILSSYFYKTNFYRGRTTDKCMLHNNFSFNGVH